MRARRRKSRLLEAPPPAHVGLFLPGGSSLSYLLLSLNVAFDVDSQTEWFGWRQSSTSFSVSQESPCMWFLSVDSPFRTIPMCLVG
jgi:hypothetical protein